MQYDHRTDTYEGTTSDGQTIVVTGDEMAEARQDAEKQGIAENVFEAELNDPTTWEALIGGNDNVWVKVGE